jgi:hypothetical protein
MLPPGRAPRPGIKNKAGSFGYLPSVPGTRRGGRNFPLNALVLRLLTHGISSVSPGTLIKTKGQNGSMVNYRHSHASSRAESPA